jgi:TolB protein
MRARLVLAGVLGVLLLIADSKVPLSTTYAGVGTGPSMPTLFGITGCCPNRFAHIDPTTGVLTPLSDVGPTPIPGGARYFFGRTGTVDGGAHRFFVERSKDMSGSSSDHILTIDTGTGVFLESPPLSVGVFNLGFDPIARQLFGITGCCPNRFVHIDPATGVLTPLSEVGPTPVPGGTSYGFIVGPAIDPSTQRFFVHRSKNTSGALSDHILTIDTVTGAFVESPALGESVASLGFDPVTGVLFGITGCCPNRFVHIDPTTGVLTPLSDVGPAPVPGGTSYGFSAGPALDASTHRFFMHREKNVSGALSDHILTIDTATGAFLESPPLTEAVGNLGFDLPDPDPPPGGGPSDGKIAFAGNRDGQGNYDIYTMHPGGSAITRLTMDPANEFHPEWSPDGSRIAFMRDPAGAGDIWVMNGDGTGQTQLTSIGGVDSAPAWSPNGAKIAFVRDGEIWSMNADGSGAANLTNDPANDLDPAWSPDGATVAFARIAASSIDIWMMNADGSNQTNLTPDGTSERAPAWSPDGLQIAFGVVSFATGERVQVDIMNADGSGRVNLVSGVSGQFFGAGEPAWSPEGARIAFTTDSEAGSTAGQLDIWTVSASGTGLTSVTTTASFDEFGPDWQRAGCAVGDWDCDGIPGIAEGECGDAIDSDGNGLINDGCPQVGPTVESGPECTNGVDDDSDGWINDGCPGATEAVACGSNGVNPSLAPERADLPGDEDGDGQANEPLPPGTGSYDCDGDGFVGSREDHIYSYLSQTNGDQKRCREYDLAFPNPGQHVRPSKSWPVDLATSAFSFNKVNLQDLSVFIAPVRYLDTDVGTNSSDVRFDLVPGSVTQFDINVVDVAALIAGPSGAPPMLGGQRAFAGPECAYPP